MKIKNIVYMASLLAVASLNAAEQSGAVVVNVDGQPQIQQQRTSADVLGELALLHPAPAEVQKNFFGRAGDHIRTAGVYAYHVGKYPIAASAFCLPFVMKCKNEIFSSFDRSIDWVVYGAVGAATAFGLYHGPSDARKQFETEKIVQESPVHVVRLNAAAETVARLENVHGALGQVQRTLVELQTGCQDSVRRLTELQDASARTERELEGANARLNDANAHLEDVVRKQQEAKVSALIETLQSAIKDTAETWERFDKIRRDQLAGLDVRERLYVAMSAFQGTQACQEALVRVNDFGEGVDQKYFGVLEVLRERVRPVLAQQRELRREIEGINRTLSLEFQEAQRAEQLRLDRQRQLALEAAASSPIPAARAVTPPPFVLQNGFDGRWISVQTPASPLMGQQRSVTPPPAYVSTPVTNGGKASTSMEEVD